MNKMAYLLTAVLAVSAVVPMAYCPVSSGNPGNGHNGIYRETVVYAPVVVKVPAVENKGWFPVPFIGLWFKKGASQVSTQSTKSETTTTSEAGYMRKALNLAKAGVVGTGNAAWNNKGKIAIALATLAAIHNHKAVGSVLPDMPAWFKGGSMEFATNDAFKFYDENVAPTVSTVVYSPISAGKYVIAAPNKIASSVREWHTNHQIEAVMAPANCYAAEEAAKVAKTTAKAAKVATRHAAAVARDAAKITEAADATEIQGLLQPGRDYATSSREAACVLSGEMSSLNVGTQTPEFMRAYDFCIHGK